MACCDAPEQIAMSGARGEIERAQNVFGDAGALYYRWVSADPAIYAAIRIHGNDSRSFPVVPGGLRILRSEDPGHSNMTARPKVTRVITNTVRKSNVLHTDYLHED